MIHITESSPFLEKTVPRIRALVAAVILFLCNIESKPLAYIKKEGTVSQLSKPDLEKGVSEWWLGFPLSCHVTEWREREHTTGKCHGWLMKCGWNPCTTDYIGGPHLFYCLSRGWMECGAPSKLLTTTLVIRLETRVVGNFETVVWPERMNSLSSVTYQIVGSKEGMDRRQLDFDGMSSRFLHFRFLDQYDEPHGIEWEHGLIAGQRGLYLLPPTRQLVGVSTKLN